MLIINYNDRVTVINNECDNNICQTRGIDLEPLPWVEKIRGKHCHTGSERKIGRTKESANDRIEEARIIKTKGKLVENGGIEIVEETHACRARRK